MKHKIKQILLTILIMIMISFNFCIPPARAQSNIAIAKVPILNVRRSPGSGSELVTQVLYNERLLVMGSRNGWTRVLVPDQYRTEQGYPGWVKTNSIKRVRRFSYIGGSWIVVSRTSTRLYRSLKAGSPNIPIYFGTSMKYLGYVKIKKTYPSGKPIYWLKCRAADGETGWVLFDHAKITDGSPFIENNSGTSLIRTAGLFTGTKYLWGGMTGRGIDCSGLTYMVYRFHGYLIPRDADQQFQAGAPVSVSSLMPGDLLFFGRGQSVTHVAIYAGGGWMIESGKSNGVVMRNMKLGNNFIGARRMFD